MTTNSIGGVLPGPVRQNSYVVRNLDQAIEGWLAIGVGPWLVVPASKQVGSVYRGQPTEPLVTIAFANSGELQIELIYQADDAPSIYREFLDSGHDGFHHMAWWTEDYEAAMAAAQAAGWSPVHYGDAGGLAKFCYFDLGGPTRIVAEVMELNDVTEAFTETIREAAATWDGSEPIRVMG